MRFAHLSDLHIGQTPVPGVLDDAVTIVEQIVRDVRRISEVLDFIVVSGDMTEDAELASFRQFEDLFATIGLPVYTVPGNHDGPAGYYRCLDRSETLSNWDITSQVVELQDLRLIGIDTCIEGETTGRVDSKAMTLIERQVARRDAPPLIIVMHHPPIMPGLRDFDAVARLDGAAELHEILRRAGTPQTILSGHVHRPYQARSNNAACFVAGSPTSAFTSDLPFGASPIRLKGLQDFYFVHEVDQGGRHVVTPQHYSYGNATQVGASS
ncbi:Calcineurin-like phosphoesterase [Jannaschia faecimaris]|uniref:Calcineurin-like phosphoesterase n=1 Tax=Jannaschia faecimaris TaxID=1244108 RepID=A0A1H3U1Y8_9RHOB|nr:metallophosphoesterase [Jannaschia faecimaris]SDZ56480.1 Calcineurin-like phosphoesterase [Jannaschia faecimaris]